MKTVFPAALAAAVLMLASCSGEQSATPAPDDNPTGLEVTNARLILPAVAGNPAAVYFDLTNAGERAVAVRRADIADAKSAELHDMMEYNREMTMAGMGPLTVKQGETVKFEPGGKHVMAFELSPEVKAGAKTELTVEAANAER
jgi:periplasmic copper chaperone A